MNRNRRLKRLERKHDRLWQWATSVQDRGLLPHEHYRYLRAMKRLGRIDAEIARLREEQGDP